MTYESHIDYFASFHVPWDALVKAGYLDVWRKNVTYRHAIIGRITMKPKA